MKAYWIVLRQSVGLTPCWGITARDKDDALYLLNQVDKSVDASMVESWAEVNSVDDLDQRHVVPNMGVIVRRGVWYPNVPGIS